MNEPYVYMFRQKSVHLGNHRAICNTLVIQLIPVTKDLVYETGKMKSIHTF